MRSTFFFSCLISTCFADFHADFLQHLRTLGRDADPCFDPEPNQLFKPIVETKKCIQSFPFQPDLNSDLLLQVNSTMKMYAFKDIASRFKSDPLKSNVDIVKEINRIQNTAYELDIDFHNDLYYSFLKLNDAHTKYKSSCYHSWLYYQPFALSAVVEPRNGSLVQNIYIQDLVLPLNATANQMWSAELGSVDSFVGYQVLSIDKQNPVKAIQTFVNNHLGIVRDPATRFNLALSRKDYYEGGWKMFYGSWPVRTSMPPRESVRYKLLSPEGQIVTINIPFIAKKPTNFDTSLNYWLRLCLPWSKETHSKPEDSTIKKLKETEVQLMQQVPFEPEVHFNPIPLRPQPFKTAKQIIDLSKPVMSGETEAFYLINDNKTAVFKLSAFVDNHIPPGPAMTRLWSKAFTLFDEIGVKNIILDFQNNGGGMICLGYSLVHFLFPNDFSAHSTDFIASDILDELAVQAALQNKTSSFFHFGTNWQDPTTSRPFADKSWMTHGPVLFRGGKMSRYTHKAQLDCDDWYSDLTINDKVPTAPRWSSENIAILSNGYCGSTCALVTRLLKDQNVRQFAVGGLLDKPMAFSEFAGGQVFKHQQLISQFQKLGLKDHPMVPKGFKVNALLSFTIREAYSKSNPELPLEFDFSPASDRIYVSKKNMNSPITLWEQVAEKMNW